MTLVVYVVTDEYVAVVSDRRVTSFVGGELISQEDTGMKTFLLGGQHLMGYTGVARFGSKSMEDWLVKPLSGVPTTEMPEAIRSAIQAVFAARTRLAVVPHVFCVAGFDVVPGSGGTTYRPVIRLISNCLSDSGALDYDIVRASFRIEEVHLGNRKQIIGAVGHRVPQELLRGLQRYVRIALKANPLDPELIYGQMVALVRQVAVASAGTVGESVLLTSLPRVVVPTQKWLLPVKKTGKLRSDSFAVAMLLRRNWSGPDDAEMYFPGMFYEDFHMTQAKLQRAK